MVQGHRRQKIWLVRYGRTFPALIENVGNYDSDLHDPDGIQHAQAMGKRIAEESLKVTNDDGAAVVRHVVSDPFLRCMRTGDIIAQELPGDLKIKVEEGTTEWQVPSLLIQQDGQRTSPQSIPELQKVLGANRIDEEYKSANPQGPDRNEEEEETATNSGCPPRFPETEEQLFKRCRTTLEKLLQSLPPGDSMVIVGHAPCVQSLALALEGSKTPAESKLGPWSLGGMTLFSRIIIDDGDDGNKSGGDVSGAKWTLEYYSDTSHMPGEYKEGKLGRWSLASFE